MKHKAMDKPGIIYTFYSYKGGVGRSMALANVAALLAKWGLRVLIVDWDLEAPGIERYFEKYTPDISEQRKKTPGVVDIIRSFHQGTEINWRNCLLQVFPFGSEYPVSVLSAGKDHTGYVSNLQGLNWEILFNDSQLGNYLEIIRKEWIAEYDFILIDSRTGITDIGGICTIYLPDILVLFFTANQQSLEGVIDVINRARMARNRLPFERNFLIGVPVPSRDESMTEYERAREWRKIFAAKLADLYQNWLHRDKTPEDALNILRIPYIPYWSFGENLPVAEEGTDDPKSIGYSYKFLAGLLANGLEWDKALKGSRYLFISQIKKEPVTIRQDAARVFISYAKEDAAMARKLSDDLENSGFPTWFDEKDLLPGQNWKKIIQQVIKECDSFIILLSDRSVSKRGFVQAEQKLAYDVMDQMREPGIYLIPVKINECEVPPRLEELHSVNLFPDYKKGLKQILRALMALTDPNFQFGTPLVSFFRKSS